MSSSQKPGARGAEQRQPWPRETAGACRPPSAAFASARREPVSQGRGQSQSRVVSSSAVSGGRTCVDRQDQSLFPAASPPATAPAGSGFAGAVDPRQRDVANELPAPDTGGGVCCRYAAGWCSVGRGRTPASPRRAVHAHYDLYARRGRRRRSPVRDGGRRSGLIECPLTQSGGPIQSHG